MGKCPWTLQQKAFRVRCFKVNDWNRWLWVCWWPKSHYCVIRRSVKELHEFFAWSKNHEETLLSRFKSCDQLRSQFDKTTKLHCSHNNTRLSCFNEHFVQFFLNLWSYLLLFSFIKKIAYIYSPPLCDHCYCHQVINIK